MAENRGRITFGCAAIALGVVVVIQLGIRVAFSPAPGSHTPSFPRCKSNLHLLSMGLNMYLQDYDDRLPPIRAWSHMLYPYVKNPRVYRCLEDTGTDSYAINRNLEGVRRAALVGPATVSFFESFLHVPNATATGWAVAQPPRHPKGNLYAFLDGSVRQLPTVPSFQVRMLPGKGNHAGMPDFSTDQQRAAPAQRAGR